MALLFNLHLRKCIIQYRKYIYIHIFSIIIIKFCMRLHQVDRANPKSKPLGNKGTELYLSLSLEWYHKEPLVCIYLPENVYVV